MRPKRGSYDAKFVKDFLMDDGGNGKNNTPTEVLMLPAGKTNIHMQSCNKNSKQIIYSIVTIE